MADAVPTLVYRDVDQNEDRIFDYSVHVPFDALKPRHELEALERNLLDVCDKASDFMFHKVDTEFSFYIRGDNGADDLLKELMDVVPQDLRRRMSVLDMAHCCPRRRWHHPPPDSRPYRRWRQEAVDTLRPVPVDTIISKRVRLVNQSPENDLPTWPFEADFIVIDGHVITVIGHWPTSRRCPRITIPPGQEKLVDLLYIVQRDTYSEMWDRTR